MTGQTNNPASRLLQEVAFFLTRSGISKSSAMKMLEDGFESQAGFTQRQNEQLTTRATYFLTRMLYFWRTRDQYVDGMGRPLPLPMHGPKGSIESVFNEARSGGHGGELSFDEAVEILEEHKTIVATKDNLYRMAKVDFDIGAGEGSALVFASHLADMATTIRRNMERAGTGERRMALFSEVDAIQEDKIGELNLHIRKSAVDWLLNIDDYLEHLQSRSEGNESTACVRVGVYLYSDKD